MKNQVIMSKLSVIILGAGKGTRMKSNLSKLLHKVGNLEMINHVINTAKKLNAEEICVVCAEENINEIKSNINKDIDTVIQYDRNGTGGAVKIGYNALKHKENNILVMYGDVPLVTMESYKKIVEMLENSNSTIVDLAFHTNNIQNKYGRLITVGDKLEEIIEYKDAKEEVRAITLCNAGILAVKGGFLGGFLDKIDNKNASNEYYLTDIIGIAQKEGGICRYIIGTEDEVMGVNSREELSIAENIFQNAKRKEFMAKGVTLLDPKTIYFSYDTEIENDVVVEQNVVFKAKVKIAMNSVIRSFSYLENCSIQSGSDIQPFSVIKK